MRRLLGRHSLMAVGRPKMLERASRQKPPGAVSVAQAGNLWYRLLNQMAEFPWNKPTPHNWRSFHPEGENHEDASCCCYSCDGDRSPRSGEGEAVAIGAPPARLSVVRATRLLPRLPSEGLVPRRRLVSGPQVKACRVKPKKTDRTWNVSVPAHRSFSNRPLRS